MHVSSLSWVASFAWGSSHKYTYKRAPYDLCKLLRSQRGPNLEPEVRPSYQFAVRQFGSLQFARKQPIARVAQERASTRSSSVEQTDS